MVMVTYECISSFNSTGACFCDTLLNHATKLGLRPGQNLFKLSASLEQQTLTERSQNKVLLFLLKGFNFQW